MKHFLFAALLATGPGRAAAIALDWQGDRAIFSPGTPDPQSPMLITELAGVPGRAQTHWNSFNGPTGSATGVLTDTGATLPAVSVQWSGSAGVIHNGTFSTMIANSPGDYRMMKGYLVADNTGMIDVTVSNIPFPLYDVILYVDDWSTALESGDFSLGSGVGLTQHWQDQVNAIGVLPADFAGQYVQSGQGPGNYLYFTGLSSATLHLTATTSNSTRVALNGMQIIGVPEPSSAMIAAAVTAALGFRRFRRSRPSSVP